MSSVIRFKPWKLVQPSVELIQWSVQMIHFPKLKMLLVSSLSSVDQIPSFLMVFSSPSMVGLSVNNFIFDKKYFDPRCFNPRNFDFFILPKPYLSHNSPRVLDQDDIVIKWCGIWPTEFWSLENFGIQPTYSKVMATLPVWVYLP